MPPLSLEFVTPGFAAILARPEKSIYPLPGCNRPAYDDSAQRRFDMDMDVYDTALALIEQHGENAIGFALRKTIRFVRKEDMKEAGRWLVIGQAVEMLAGMPPVTRRH